MCGVRKGRSGSEHDQDFLAGQNKRQKSILRLIFGLHSDFRHHMHDYAHVVRSIGGPLDALVFLAHLLGALEFRSCIDRLGDGLGVP